MHVRAVLLLCLVACAEPPGVFSAPFLEGGRSLFLFVDGAPRALDAEEQTRIVLPHDGQERSLLLAAFSETLAELRVASGMLDRPQEISSPWPEPMAAWRATAREEISAWQELPGARDVLPEGWLPARSCVKLELGDEHLSAAPEAHAGLISTEGGPVLIAGAGEVALLRPTPLGSTLMRVAIPSLAGVHVRASFVDTDARLWVGGARGGAAYLGRLNELSVEYQVESSSISSLVAVEGGLGIPMYALSETGQLAISRDSRLEILAEGTGTSSPAGALLVEPTSIFMLRAGRRGVELYLVDAQRVEREESALDQAFARGQDWPVAFLDVPGDTYYVGTERGAILRREVQGGRGVWPQFRGGLNGESALAFAPLGLGGDFLVGGGVGRIEVYDARAGGFCFQRAATLGAARRIERLLLVEDFVYASGRELLAGGALGRSFLRVSRRPR